MRFTIARLALGSAFALAAGLITASALPARRASTSTVPPDRGREREAGRAKSPGVHRAGPAELAVLHRVTLAESAKIQARLLARKVGAARGPAAASVPANNWVSLGPTDAPKEFNFFEIDGVDSGRPNAIVMDPRDANVVYVAVSGGGVWKTFDFLSPSGTTWFPTTDTRPNLAVGALAIHPTRPDTLYMGNGDFVDASGNTITKTTDGGATWLAPVLLSGTYPSGAPAQVSAIREISAAGNVVFAATDAGLFKSTDDGASFALVDLPNEGGLLLESVWSIVPTGGDGWVASGLTACDVGAPPPSVFGGVDPTPGVCPQGNNTEIWRTDDGTTWSLASQPAKLGTGRTTIAAGATSDPAHTVLYAYVGAVDGASTAGFWRSMDSGKTWAIATGTLANPTVLGPPNNDNSCVDMDIGHGQTWYNQAITVDPTNPDHVLVGGNLCGVRTLNGTAAAPTWELVSHWLPGTAFGETANGRLGYVHADWHTATSVVGGDKLWTFAGTDGGVFVSNNVFDPGTQAEKVVWTHHNRGLATHLMYSVASGDPVTANPFVLFGGLQDNGTRFRADPRNPSAFNQPIGGDGIGATVHTAGARTTYWASVEFGWAFCKPAETDCTIETPEAATDAKQHWHSTPSPVGLTPEQIAERATARAQRWGEDAAPFLVHYANVEPDKAGPSVLTHTDEQVFVNVSAGTGFTWKSISQDLTSDPNGSGINNVSASRTIRGLYGAAGTVSIKPFYVTTMGNTKTTWRVAQPVHPDGTTKRLTGPSYLDFPPVTPAGKHAGDVYIGAFVGTMNDPARTPPPDAQGHLYRTSDGGVTWASIVGGDPAHRLPNVGVNVVKYDPVTPTTIYAGTALGLYITTDDGATWNRMGDGLPVVPVRDIYVARNQDFIRVATYGRGLWEIYPSAAANQGAPGNGDYDRNLQLDWVDLGAMSSRLGVTPAQQVPPLYSWIMDITGAPDAPVQQIDGADLASLLARFGDHP